jgi:2-keto-3-deoxy-L-rhamnonate aldolase RhmA
MNARGEREKNKLKRDLLAGKYCVGAVLTLSSPPVAEMLSRAGFDWLWLETEHTALGLENLQYMLQATNGSDVSTIVRVPWNDKTMIKRVLDLGPDGLIIPLVNSKEEAEYAVRAMKYPPWGERGAGMNRAQFYGGQLEEYLKTANDEVMTILMIEHIKAVHNIDEILTVKGVDSIMIGALDLSGSMGLLGQTSHPEVEAAVQTVLAACKRADIPAGIITLAPEQANRRMQEGFANVIVGIDIVYLLSSAKEAARLIVRPAPRTENVLAPAAGGR